MQLLRNRLVVTMEPSGNLKKTKNKQNIRKEHKDRGNHPLDGITTAKGGTPIICCGGTSGKGLLPTQNINNDKYHLEL